VSTFESLALSKHPRPAVFEATRDAMSEAALDIEYVDRVVTERRVESPGTVELVNVWHARVPIPDAIAGLVKPHMLVWRDRAVWTSDDWCCRWSVTSHFFPRAIRCSGITSYDETMRGQATRVSLRGEVVADTRGLGGLGGLVEAGAARAVEEFVCALFPSGLRQAVDGVSRYLSARAPGH
jgi:hypothetical protein